MAKKKVFGENALPYFMMPVGGTRPDPIVTDPLGSYTGRPSLADELPVQDVDDL